MFLRNTMVEFQDDTAVQEQIKKVIYKLQAKMEEMDGVEELNQTLIVKERQSNDELQEARKELIKDLQDMLSTCANIGVKSMGDIVLNIFAFYGAHNKVIDPNDQLLKYLKAEWET
ncbi:hypothetical protein Hanom_Chr06g00523891 [Helianthus anomalus]